MKKFEYYNEKYNRTSSYNDFFTMLNPEHTLDIVAPIDIKVPELIFNLPEDATGSIIVSVDSKNYGLNLLMVAPILLSQV